MRIFGSNIAILWLYVDKSLINSCSYEFHFSMIDGRHRKQHVKLLSDLDHLRMTPCEQHGRHIGRGSAP